MKADGWFYDRFSAACKSRGRSPTSVVRACGLSSCLITAWKRGGKPNVSTLEKLSSELELPISALLTEHSTQSVP